MAMQRSFWMIAAAFALCAGISGCAHKDLTAPCSLDSASPWLLWPLAMSGAVDAGCGPLRRVN